MSELHWAEEFLSSLATSRADRVVSEVPLGDPAEARDLDDIRRLAWCVQQLVNNDRRIASSLNLHDRRLLAIESALVSLIDELVAFAADDEG